MDGPYATHIGVLEEQLATMQRAPLEYKANRMRIPAGVSQPVAELYREKAAAMKRDQEQDRKRELDRVAVALGGHPEHRSRVVVVVLNHAAGAARNH